MSVRALILILILIFTGFVLEHLALPGLLAELQVPWLVFVLTALLLSAPHYFGIIAALVLGLLLDVEHGQPFGLNSIILVVHVLFLRLNLRRFKIHGWAMVVTIVPILIALDLTFANLFLWLARIEFTLPVLAPVLTSFIVWPLFYALYQAVVNSLRLS